MCLFSSFFLSRLLCQMSSKSSRKSSEKKTKKRDRFIGRTCNKCFFSRERETQKISSLFFFKMSLSFFLSFFLFQSRSNSPSATKSFSFVSTKRPKKIDPTQKKKRKKETQHRPPHPKRIQSVLQSRRQRRRRQREETTETKREKERRVL